MTQLDKNITLMCAQRYAMGRMTYVVSSVVNEIIENWDNFKKGNKEGIKKEIKEAIINGQAGMQCDIDEWSRILHLNSHNTSNKSEEKNEKM